MVQRYSDRAPVRLVSGWLGLPASTYYYKHHPGPRGKMPSSHTAFNGQLVSNQVVIEEIKKLISGPYNAYGYQSVTDDLSTRISDQSQEDLPTDGCA